MHPHRSRRAPSHWHHPFVDPSVLKSVVVAAILLAALMAGIVLITRGLV